MKYYFFFFFILISSLATAQAPPPAFKISETTVVKDSSGTVYTYAIWVALLKTHEYMLKPVNGRDVNTEFILCRLSEEENTRRDSKTPKPLESSFFKTGQTISSFRTKDMNGNKFILKELIGKTVVLNFWFINCPPCRQEIPELNKVVEQYKDNKNVVFLAIALDNMYDLKEFLKTLPYNYNIVDEGRYIAQQYGINLYPTHVVLDTKGIVRFHTSGFGSGTLAWLKKTIEQSVNEKVE